MIVNIGPWWLYDIIALSIIVGGLIFGIKRGFFMTLYIIGIELIAVILLMFIPTMLTNATIDPVMSLLRKAGLESKFDSVSTQVGNVFRKLLQEIVDRSSSNGDFNVPDLNSESLGSLLLKVAAGLSLYIIYSFAIFILVNIIGFIVFACIKNKFRKIKVLGYADKILGGINGFGVGMIFAMMFSWIISMPFIATETQKFGTMSYSQLDEDQQNNWAKYGNSYSRFALSHKMTTDVPVVKFAGYLFSNACIQKYLLAPVATIGSQFFEKGFSTDSIKSVPQTVLETYSELVLDGYASKDPWKAPIPMCIEIMPNDTRVLLRFATEMMLLLSKVISPSDSTTTEGTDQNSGNTTTNNADDDSQNIYSNLPSTKDILNSFEQFRTEKQIEFNKNDTLMNLDNFTSYYNWAGDDVTKNPFLKNVANLEGKNAKASDKKLASILRDPVRTYSLFRNIFYVNWITSDNSSVPGFVPSIWSSNFVADSLELSFSPGIYNFLTSRLANDWDNLNENSKLLLGQKQDAKYEDFRGFWLQYYFDFAKLEDK
ncbi:hypothetical protein SHELI_v1c07000 [Spiroplasma helicoides]|uniref:CvpA family protein n=1 Tax=Spiroplasma helicoides TaxID=216938 RepID=A0A1B3SL43_9MOLU|nr:CvpA family protein [Spiroplasma helicoides]AOG60649.1 hypothetical protein SHELI_v1c07000 [Spiroplasma helicoides]